MMDDVIELAGFFLLSHKRNNGAFKIHQFWI